MLAHSCLFPSASQCCNDEHDEILLSMSRRAQCAPYISSPHPDSLICLVAKGLCPLILSWYLASRNAYCSAQAHRRLNPRHCTPLRAPIPPGLACEANMGDVPHVSHRLPISFFICLTALPLKRGNSQVCTARGKGTSNLSPGDVALWRAEAVRYP